MATVTLTRCELAPAPLFAAPASQPSILLPTILVTAGDVVPAAGKPLPPNPATSRTARRPPLRSCSIAAVVVKAGPLEPVDESAPMAMGSSTIAKASIRKPARCVCTRPSPLRTAVRGMDDDDDDERREDGLVIGDGEMWDVGVAQPPGAAPLPAIFTTRRCLNLRSRRHLRRPRNANAGSSQANASGAGGSPAWATGSHVTPLRRLLAEEAYRRTLQMMMLDEERRNQEAVGAGMWKVEEVVVVSPPAVEVKEMAQVVEEVVMGEAAVDIEAVVDIAVDDDELYDALVSQPWIVDEQPAQPSLDQPYVPNLEPQSSIELSPILAAAVAEPVCLSSPPDYAAAASPPPLTAVPGEPLTRSRRVRSRSKSLPTAIAIAVQEGEHQRTSPSPASAVTLVNDDADDDDAPPYTSMERKPCLRGLVPPPRRSSVPIGATNRSVELTGGVEAKVAAPVVLDIPLPFLRIMAGPGSYEERAARSAFEMPDEHAGEPRKGCHGGKTAWWKWPGKCSGGDGGSGGGGDRHKTGWGRLVGRVVGRWRRREVSES
ncbi:hypothetical protein HK101_009102 [Irineochytrium annulatum]|nr:hypothetical protein HK101_009102 [Irineochytrium annulatum]